MHPNAPYIRRNGEVNAWDNPEFRAAVEATGKKQVILAGIVTEVCTSTYGLLPVVPLSRSTHKAIRYRFPRPLAKRSWLLRLGQYRCKRNVHPPTGARRE